MVFKKFKWERETYSEISKSLPRPSNHHLLPKDHQHYHTYLDPQKITLRVYKARTTQSA